MAQSDGKLVKSCLVQSEQARIMFSGLRNGYLNCIEHGAKGITCASAGSRTRIDCLEGNHANRYTTDAC